jgi:outer membrane protein
MKYNKRLLVSSIVMFLVVGTRAAAGPSEGEVGAGERLSLGASIDLALEQNHDVRIAREKIEESRRQVHEAVSAFLPMLGATASFQQIDKPPSVDLSGLSSMMGQTGQTGTGQTAGFSLTPDKSYQGGLVATQPLFMGGRLINTHKMAKNNLRSKEEDFNTVRTELVFQAKQSYYSVLLAKRFEDVAEHSVTMLEAHLRDVKNYVEYEVASRVDLLRTEVQRADAEQRLNSARNAVDLSKSAFNNLLNRDLTLPVEIEDVLAYTRLDISLEEATSIAQSNRPEAKSVEALVDVSKSGVRVAQAGYLPTIGFQGTYQWHKGTQLQFQGEDWHWTIGLSGSLTLWDWGGTYSRVKQARSRLNQAELGLEKLRDGIALQVREAYLKMQEAEKNIGVAETAVSSAEESYRTVKDMYREGVGTNTDVLDAQTALVGAEGNLYRALYDYNIALAKIERAMGVERQ